MNDDRHCQDLLQTLSDYVDGELGEQLCHELEQHLQECDNCTIVVDTLRKTLELYRQRSLDPLPDEVRNRLYKRLDLVDFIT